MKQAIRSFAVIAFCCCIPVAVGAQTLWRDARVGMSLEATQSKFPKAARPLKPSSLRDGSLELLRLRNIPVQGRNFDALFFFKEKKLVQTSLELEETGDVLFATRAFRGIKTAFDSKYGPPDDEQDQSFETPTGLATFRMASWRSGPTLITLSCATAAGKLQILNIAYRSAGKSEGGDI